MRVYAPVAFRNAGVDYPFGWQDLPNSVADSFLSAGLVALTNAGIVLAQKPGQAGLDDLSTQVLTDSGVRRKSYLGQVATRSGVMNWTNAGNKQMMSRSLHKAREHISKLKIAIPNWYVAAQTAPSNGTEANNGASTSVTASIEYPVGVFSQVTFSSSITGTIPAGGTIISDWVPVTIPDGAEFFVRLWTNNANGLIYCSTHIGQAGEMNAYGVTTPDLTMGGSFASATAIIQVPCAIIGSATQPSYYFAGDSRGFGVNDTADISRDVGQLARTIGKKFAYINGCVSSERVQLASANYAKRLELAAYCSHVISNFGINDNRSNSGNRSAALVMTDLNTFANLFGGKPFYQCTIPPYTSSTDSFATTANQSTAINTNHAELLVLNNSIRSGGVASAYGVIELYNAVTTAGVWTPNFTTDGLHESRQGNLAIQSSNVVAVAAA